MHRPECERNRSRGSEKKPSGTTLAILSRDRKTESSLLPNVKELLAEHQFVPSSNTVWLGHDRITGEITIAAAQKLGGRSALIHHMSYSHYEAYAAGAQQAAEKEAVQECLFSKADKIFAIGPILRDALADITERDVSMLIPGLPEIKVSDSPKTFTAFLSGRISDDTSRIKQAHLGIASFAHSIFRSNDDQGLPKALNSSNNPTLKVRGLHPEQRNMPAVNNPEIELQRFAEQYAGAVINLRALDFTTDREVIFNALRRSSLALMPSWHEGFGLVAWEAIAAGVPLILSKKSGVYHFLQHLDNGLYVQLVHGVDIRGRVDAPYFHKDDLKLVSDRIIGIAQDQKAARAKAAQLRETLLRKGYSWADCARQFAAEVEWNTYQRGTCSQRRSVKPKALPPFLRHQLP